MSSSIFELILTFGFGLLVAAIAFLWTRKSLTSKDDDILPREETKPKVKITKQPTKAKPVKKEPSIVKPKSAAKPEPKAPVIVVSNKNQGSAKTLTESVAVPTVERSRHDSTIEWTKVSKSVKKTKKESRPEPENVFTNDNVKIAIKENSAQEGNKSKTTEKDNKKKEVNVPKTDLPKENIIEKVNEKQVDQNKSAKPKKFVTIEIESESKNETKPKATGAEIASTNPPNEGSDLVQKFSEMRMELDKLKNSQKDDLKPNSQTLKELESLKVKLKSSQANEEKLLEDLRKKGQAVTDLKNQFLIIQSELTKNIVANQSVNREKTSLENQLRTLKEQNSLLTEKSMHFDQLQLDNEELNKNCSAIEQELQSAKHEYADRLKSQEQELSTQINKLQTDKQRMQDQLVRVQTDLIENNNKMQSTQQELLVAKSSYADLMAENLRLQKSGIELDQATALFKQQQLKEIDNKCKLYEEQIVGLKKQISDINVLNITLSGQKSDLETQIEQLRTAPLVIDNSQTEVLNKTIEQLQQQIADMERQFSVTESQCEQLRSTMDIQIAERTDLLAERDNLLGLVDQYKTGLESTELILSKLQTSVNEEETKWRESLIKSEAEAEKSKRELEIVFNDLIRIRNSRAEKNELNFAYHCVDKSLSSLIDEMEARMVHFEKSLEAVVQERDSALAKMSSVQINGVAMDEDGPCSDAEHVVFNDNEHGDSLERLKADLDHQIELNRSLENQCNKYRSLIGIGEDALAEEQNHVRELEEKLLALDPCSNTPVSIGNNAEMPLSSS